MTPRAASTTTKAVVWAAAHRLFSERGYASTTVRDIATEAGIDPALVIRHFGTKQALFLETMQLDEQHRSMLDGPIETLGERFISSVLDAEGNTRSIFLALLRASDTEGIGSRLKKTHDTQFVAPLLGRLTGEDAELRARLAAALVGGMLYSLWVVGDDYLVATDHAELVRRYGAMLQQLITPA